MITQLEFNRYNYLMKTQPELYKEYLYRQIANLYIKKPHGRGMSASDIVKTLHVTHKTVQDAVITVLGEWYWRDRDKGIQLAASRKIDAWQDSKSGYNTSPKMWHKKRYKVVK